MYASATSEKELINLIKDRGNEIVETFRAADIRYLQNIFVNKRLDDSQYKTFQNLNISLTIPEEFRTVDDTGEFLWLRQHLKSGIAPGRAHEEPRSTRAQVPNKEGEGPWGSGTK